jgi:hypothetical protein
MRKLVLAALTLSVSFSGAAAAQVPDWVTQLLAAALLPVSAAEARNEGVSDAEVRAVLAAMRDAKLSAHEARDVLDEGRAARRDHGPVDNFGAFVQSKLQAGLRGRELAAAIKAEHVARGKGKPGQPGKSAQAQKKGADARNDTISSKGKGRPATDKKGADAKGRPNRPTR